MKLNNKHCEDLYNKIRNRFEKITMVDENGSLTLVPRDAKIFNMLFMPKNKDSMVTLSMMEPTELKIYFNRQLTNEFGGADKDRWFKFVNELRAYTIPRQLGFDLIDLDTAGLTVTDIKSLIQDRRSKEKMAESKFSRLEGSTRSSYQMLERVKIKVRHKGIVKDDIHGARSRNISSIFIENNQGERFRFPYPLLNGARAMARHIEEGGMWSDRVGQRILEVSDSLSTIRSFVREARKKKAFSEKSVPLLKMLKERHSELRKDLKLMNGSRGYKFYVSNLAETYYEPMPSITNYFTSIPEGIEQYLPKLEKILSEKSIDNAVDRTVAECITFINNITEAVASPPKKVTLDSTMIRALGIQSDPRRLVERIPRDKIRQFTHEYSANRLTPPQILKSQADGSLKYATVDDQYKLWWLMANFPPDQNNIQVAVSLVRGDPGVQWGRRSDDTDSPTGEPRPEQEKSWGDRARAAGEIIDTLRDPFGAIGKKLRGGYY